MPGRPGSCRILFADREPSLRSMALDCLTRSGYDVELSGDGRDALRRYRPGAFDLLILDVMLSCRSGFEIVIELRHSGDGVPIVLTSASSTGAGRVEPFAFAYRVELLRKPFGTRDLRAAVERARGQRGA